MTAVGKLLAFALHSLLLIASARFSIVNAQSDSNATPKTATVADKYHDQAIDLVGRLFEWWDEQRHLRPDNKRPARDQWKFAEYPWIVGIRGYDEFLKWYPYSECMGTLMKKHLVLTLCSCVYSWYSYHHQTGITPEQEPPFTRHKFSDINYDIAAENLVAYQMGLDLDKGFWRVDGDQSYVGVINRPVTSVTCDKALIHREEMYGSFVLLELIGPVWHNNKIYSPTYRWGLSRKDAFGGTKSLLTYGTTPTDPLVIFEDQGIANLKKKLVEMTITIKESMSECKTDIFPPTAPLRVRACGVPASEQLCHTLPGAPIVSVDGSVLEGFALQKGLCSAAAASKMTFAIWLVGCKNCTSEPLQLVENYKEQKQKQRNATDEKEIDGYNNTDLLQHDFENNLDPREMMLFRKLSSACFHLSASSRINGMLAFITMLLT